jgi:hypothetical protein
MHLKKHLQMHWDQERRRRRRLGNNHKLNSLVFTSGDRNQQANTHTHTHTQRRASWLFVCEEVCKKKAPHSLMELITVDTT